MSCIEKSANKLVARCELLFGYVRFACELMQHPVECELHDVYVSM